MGLSDKPQRFVELQASLFTSILAERGASQADTAARWLRGLWWGRQVVIRFIARTVAIDVRLRI